MAIRENLVLDLVKGTCWRVGYAWSTATELPDLQEVS